ncbi:MAG TPA: RNA polymerase sigma factor [Phycisphaerae bacterium]|nr:RNA polymerase sigma factor [Phycisphaerae bacterium]HNU44387.1 RNA polymerase sigma factor [Phycisphaerae bacterium]
MELPVWMSGVGNPPLAAEAEADLVERAKHDRDAFASLYRTHCRAVAGYVFRRTGDEHATDDLVGETFVAALRALPRYHWRGIPVRAWLLRIATHEVNRWARRQRRAALRNEPGAAALCSGAEADAAAWKAEVVRSAMLTLKPQYQSVLALHYLEGLPLDEVAAVTGWRLGTVKSRLARAREALRKTLSARR